MRVLKRWIKNFSFKAIKSSKNLFNKLCTFMNESMFSCEGQIYCLIPSTNEWKHIKEESDTSNISIVHTKGTFAAIIATAEQNKVVLLKIVFNSDVTYEPVSDDPLFHRLNDGKDIWGIKFFNKESSEEFRSRIISIISEYKTSDKSNNTSTPPPQIKVPPKKAPIKKMPLVSKNPPPLPKISSQAKTTPNNSRCVHQNSLRKIPKGFVSQQQHIFSQGQTENNNNSILSVKITNKAEDKDKEHMQTTEIVNTVEENDAKKHEEETTSSLNLTNEPSTTSPLRDQPSFNSGDQTNMSPFSQGEKNFRVKIIDEILKTETDYVDSLNILRDMYYLPLKYAPRFGVVIFKPGDFEKIFYGFDTIHLLNKELLSELKSKKSQGTLYNECGKVFNVFSHSMKLYIDYVNKYDNTIKLISEYEEKNETFRKMLQASMEDVDCQYRGLKDFLIMPIQRIPRYVLLLQQLKSKTDENHEDYEDISKALSTIESIAGYINNQKKDYEDKEKVTIIQQRLNPKCETLLKEGRSYVFDGIVYVKNYNFIPPKKPIKVKPNKPDPPAELLGLREIELFLMNDLILWAEKDSKHNYLNEIKRIDLWEVIDCIQGEPYRVSFYPISEGHYNSFTLKTRNSTEVPLFYVYQSEKHTFWMNKIINEFTEATRKKKEERDRIAKANELSYK